MKKKKTVLIGVIVIVVMLIIATIMLTPKEYIYLDVVPEIDPAQYQGLWYDIMEYPVEYNLAGTIYNSSDFINTTANYALNTDGTFHAVTGFIYGSMHYEIEGTLRFTGANHNGSMELSYIPFIWTPYQVLGIGPDYNWSVVGTPDYECLFLLHRSPDPGILDISQMIDLADAKGFNVSKLVEVER